MTPKEHAWAIYRKFNNILPVDVHKDVVKECALSEVDAIIGENSSLLAYAETHMDERAKLVLADRVKYLQEVRQEIFNYKP